MVAPTITVEQSVSSIRKSYCPSMRRVSLKPLDGTWGVKYRKVYELDAEGNRIPDGKGGWGNHKEDANDRNNKGNAEKWRTAQAAHLNKTLQSKGVAARISDVVISGEALTRCRVFTGT